MRGSSGTVGRRFGKFRRNLREGDPPLLYKEFEHFDDFKEVFQRDLNIWLNERERPWFKPVESVVEQRLLLNQTKKADREQARPRWTSAARRPTWSTLTCCNPTSQGASPSAKCLTEWFTGGSRPVCVVEAIGGMGKSALAWFWLHADVLGIPPGWLLRSAPEKISACRRTGVPRACSSGRSTSRTPTLRAFLDRAARYVGVSR